MGGRVPGAGEEVLSQNREEARDVDVGVGVDLWSFMTFCSPREKKVFSLCFLFAECMGCGTKVARERP